MTTSIKKQLSLDLVENASWPMFSARPDLKEDCSVAAYTLTWRSSEDDVLDFSDTSAKDLERRIVRVTEALGFTLQAFVAHSTMQPRAATVLYRKIWKTTPMKFVPVGVELGFENLIECVPGVRFASLANIPLIAIPWMVSIIDKFDVVVPILLRAPFNIRDTGAMELARIAFPPGGCSVHSSFDWAAFSCHVAKLGGFCVRRTGGVAAREIAVDFFASGKDMPALVQILERDDGLDMYRVH